MTFPRLLLVAMFMAIRVCGQQTVCELFKNLEAANGRELTLTGDLVISKDVAVIGAFDCDHEYITQHHTWPTALFLKPSRAVSPEQAKRFRDAAVDADRLRREGKTVNATVSVTGHLHLRDHLDLAGEFTFDSLNDVRIIALPDRRTLPVIPICELFQDLPKWKGKRIAVRGIVAGTMEGSWLVGACKGNFYTNGYRWPVSLSTGLPAYFSPPIYRLVEEKQPRRAPKHWEEFRGRYSVVKTATYVGRLRMRDRTTAVCREWGAYTTLGFGHLGASAAEIVVEEVKDVELSKSPSKPSADDRDEYEQECQPPDFAARCATARLAQAAGIGCTDRVAELLRKEGIDSKGGNESEALSAAITGGHDEIVRMLLKAGAPVNPRKLSRWPPLFEAGHRGHIAIMKTLLASGANVDGLDSNHETFVASEGAFDSGALTLLLDSGADPNAADQKGATALMQASKYGFEDAIRVLLQHHADVNRKDASGRTALMYAAAGKYVDAIPLLLSHGADLNAVDRSGQTALDLARISNNEVATEMLSNARR